MSRVPLLRPEFGPTLPELISRRFSISRRAAVIAALVAFVILTIVIKLATDNGLKKLVVHGSPTFNVLYDPSRLHEATPQGGELMHLAGRAGHVDVAVTAKHANLPPYKGDTIGGQLPEYTGQLAARLARQLPGFALGTEGKARVNQALGYQISYTSKEGGNPTNWREVFVLPSPDKPEQAIDLVMRQTFIGRPGPRGRALLQATKKAFRSFRFGTGRALFG
jgi:hypothetical protein